MKYGYIKDALQNEESIAKQTATLKEYGVETIIVEKSNGTDLIKLLEELTAGDSLYVVSLDRLTRNMNKAIEIREFLEEKGATLYVGGSPFNIKNLLPGFFR